MNDKNTVSIVIPAHNEADVISHCLRYLLKPCGALELEIIVVCNGCTDNTAVIASSYEGIICIESEVASKAHALNLGDKVASYFPRFYLDADIRLNANDILKVVVAMEERNALLAVPSVQMDLSGSPWLVKSYYEVWCDLPYCKEVNYGAGVYAVSEVGRKRFAEFPAYNFDGLYARCLFKGKEKIGVKDAISIVGAPTSLNGLIKIKTRSRMGIWEFKENFPELVENEKKAYGTAIREVLVKVQLWPKVLVYMAINVFTRFCAHRMIKTKGFSHWEVDMSSRVKMRNRHD